MLKALKKTSPNARRSGAHRLPSLKSEVARFATARKTNHQLTQFVAALIVTLDEARDEIARLKGKPRPPRFLDMAKWLR